MKKIVLIFLIFTFTTGVEAQQTATSAGEYYLRGVMETASGFKLNEDSTFEFFFSYGALDRSGKGTWQLKGNQLILNSPKPKGQSFALVTNEVEKNDFITIKILEENPSFLSSVYAIVRSGTKQLEAISEKGVISFPRQPVDSIILLFEFCPEKKAVFTFANKLDNYFEFRLEPTIMDVYFDNLVLNLEEKGFYGKHPLLKEGLYHFIKN